MKSAAPTPGALRALQEKLRHLLSYIEDLIPLAELGAGGVQATVSLRPKSAGRKPDHHAPGDIPHDLNLDPGVLGDQHESAIQILLDEGVEVLAEFVEDLLETSR